MNFARLVNKLLELKEKDKEIDIAFEAFVKTISPDYSPFIEFNWVMWYLEAIRIVDESLHSDLSRYLYDIDWDKKDTRNIVTKNWDFMINNKDDFINYLEKEYEL